MFCPRCGIENTNEQRFCRSCGLDMDVITQMVTGELAGSTDNLPLRRQQIGSLTPVIYGLALIILGTVLGTIGKKVLGEQGVADIGTLISVLGVGLLALKGIFLLQQTRFSQPQKTQQSIGQSAVRQPLPSAEAPSITEQTTRQLDPARDSEVEIARKTNHIQS
jgi:zinc ribbon protein